MNLQLENSSKYKIKFRCHFGEFQDFWENELSGNKIKQFSVPVNDQSLPFKYVSYFFAEGHSSEWKPTHLVHVSNSFEESYQKKGEPPILIIQAHNESNNHQRLVRVVNHDEERSSIWIRICKDNSHNGMIYRKHRIFQRKIDECDRLIQCMPFLSDGTTPASFACEFEFKLYRQFRFHEIHIGTYSSLPGDNIPSDYAEHLSCEHMLSTLKKKKIWEKFQYFYLEDPVNTLHEKFPPKKKFRDSEFPIGEKIILSDIDTSKTLRQKYKSLSVYNYWRRLDDLSKQRHASATLFRAGVSNIDVIQGKVGNCWLLACCCSLAECSPETIQNMFNPSHYNPQGYYSVKLMIDGLIGYILIDDYLLVDKLGEPVFASSSCKNEYWICLLEKAAAKWAGCYQNLRGGIQNIKIPIGWSRFQSAISLVPLSNSVCWKRGYPPFNLFDLMKRFSNKRYIATTGTFLNQEGLISSHSYSILGVVEAYGHRLVKLRNPWGFGEFTGEWSDESHLWEKYPMMKELVNFKKEKDGIFFMSFEHFVKLSSQIQYTGPIIPAERKKILYDFIFAGCYNQNNRSGNIKFTLTCNNHYEILRATVNDKLATDATLEADQLVIVCKHYTYQGIWNKHKYFGSYDYFNKNPKYHGTFTTNITLRTHC